MLKQTLSASVLIKKIRLKGIKRNVKPSFQILHIDTAHQKGVVADDLPGAVSDDLIQQLFIILHLRQVIIAGGDVRDGYPAFSLKPGNAHDIVVALLIHTLYVQIGTRGDNSCDLTLHQSSGLLRILHLLTDRHLIALSHQPV